MQVTLTRMTPNPIIAIEEAAANCYASTPHEDGRTMMQCYASGHHSILEFCDMTFHIEGVSRALSHQLVRSRLMSFAQRSQRYTKEDGFDYVTPKSIATHLEARCDYENLMEFINEEYQNFVDYYEIPKEDARFVLPNACTTTLECKCNLRELMHFCNERMCSCAQWEIKELAYHMRDAVVEQEPRFRPFLVPKCERNPDLHFCTESKKRSCGRFSTPKEIATKYEEE